MDLREVDLEVLAKKASGRVLAVVMLLRWFEPIAEVSVNKAKPRKEMSLDSCFLDR